MSPPIQEQRGNSDTSLSVFTAVVTRPAGQSAELLEKLTAEGIEAFEFPLIDIQPINDAIPLIRAFESLETFALAVFVSPNAIDQAFAHQRISWPRALPIGVPGPGSVAALARHGITVPAYRVISPRAADEAARFDSEALFEALIAEFGERGFEGKSILIVRGDGGREWLAERLRERGAQVRAVAAYRRALVQPTVSAWQRVYALLAGAPHAWLVTSSESLRNLDTLAGIHLNEAEIATLKQANLITPYARIAESAYQLGFDSITVCGAGDSSIVRAFSACAEQHRALINPPVQVPTRMSDTTDTRPVSSSPDLPHLSSTPPVKRGIWSLLLLWCAVIALLAAAGVGGYALNRKIERVDERLAQRQLTAETLNAEVRLKAAQALEATQQTNARIAQLEGRLTDAQTMQQALQQQYAELAHNRDDWTLAEVEQMLGSASAQLQLTGNVQLALFALQNADTRLAALASPKATVVRKAVAHDIDKLKAVPPATDLTGLAIKLDDAIAQIDTLPLVGEALINGAPQVARRVSAASDEPRWKTWWREFTAGIGQQLASLVQVRRLDSADPMLISPEQGYFIRENLKLRLLSARLALASRNETLFTTDMHAADTALMHYFDASSKQTQAVHATLTSIAQHSASVELPNLDSSLQALHQYQHGSGQ